MISRYIHISNQHIGHFKLTQSYVSLDLNKAGKIKDKTPEGKNRQMKTFS